MHEDSRRDIDWDALDKRKFFVYGTGVVFGSLAYSVHRSSRAARG